MLSNRLLRMTTILVVVLLSRSAGAWRHQRGQKALVRFWATSTLVRGTWGLNQDIYLAELRFPKQHESVLMRLIDAYPNEWPPLSREVLVSQSGTELRIKRDSRCDLSFSRMQLRTAPGDPMAILPVRLGYSPHLQIIPSSSPLSLCCNPIFSA